MVQHGARVIANIHGGVDGQQEETNPKHIATPQQMRVGTHDQGKRFAMAKLVIAPALKPAKDGVEALVWISFQLTVDGDVAGIANFLGQVSRVENVFGFEVGIGLGALQVTQVDTQTKVLQSLIDETGVTRFIARHVTHQLFDVGVFNISKNFVVQDATRKLGGQRGN